MTIIQKRQAREGAKPIKNVFMLLVYSVCLLQSHIFTIMLYFEYRYTCIFI